MDLSNENIVHVKKDGIEFLQFRRLLEYDNIITHAYSLGKNMNFRTSKKEEEEESINCYKKLCNNINCNYINVIKPRQNHTNTVKIVERKINKNEPDINLEEYLYTDGLITNKSQYILSTTNADCLLLLFFDPVKKVIANIHSGWKGTLQRISVEAVNKMKNNFDCKAEDIICCMCPSIRKCHFEVEEDVKNMFIQEFKEIDGFIEETVKNKKWHIDTIGINKELLIKEGLREENIIDSKICSVCNKELIHSYRIEGKDYELATAIIELI